MAIGAVSLFVCEVANRKRGTVDEGPHRGSAGGVASTVGARQGRDAETQGLTRRAVKRGQAGMHSRVTDCWHVPPLKSNREGLHRQSGRVKEETLTLLGCREEQSREHKSGCMLGPPSAGTCRR